MPGHAPSFVSTSLWHTPHACTLIRTCPAPGRGISLSTISKFPPALETCTAFIGAMPTFVVAIFPPLNSQTLTAAAGARLSSLLQNPLFGFLTRRHLRRKLLRLSPWHAQRLLFPGRFRRVMFREEHNLSHVVRVMRHLPCNRLHRRMRRRPNRHNLRQIRIRQRRHRVEHVLPSALPHRHQFRARLRRVFELGVAVPVRLLPVAGQKIRPSRPHVPRHMLDDNGNRVRFLVQRRKQPSLRTLFHRPLRQLFVVDSSTTTKSFSKRDFLSAFYPREVFAATLASAPVFGSVFALASLG